MFAIYLLEDLVGKFLREATFTDYVVRIMYVFVSSLTEICIHKRREVKDYVTEIKQVPNTF